MRSPAGVVVSLVVLGLVAGPALAYTAGSPSPAPAVATPVVQADNTTVSDDNQTNGSGLSLGGQLSAFMQSNAVAANTSIENGMWRAGVIDSNGSQSAASVENRIKVLERRHQRLQTRLDQFKNERLTARDPAAVAQMARLSTRIQTLQSSINETGEVATQLGVNVTRLDALRTDARNMTGHEVAALARNLSIGPPSHVPVGPPEETHRGPPADRKQGPGDTDRNSPNRTERGPPETTAVEGTTGNQSNGASGETDVTTTDGPPRTDDSDSIPNQRPPTNESDSQSETTAPGRDE